LTEPLDEGLVFARHNRVEGVVLIIGVGTVGSSLAMQLALLGIDLRLVDKDILEPQNIVRHQAGAPYLRLARAILSSRFTLLSLIEYSAASLLIIRPARNRLTSSSTSTDSRMIGRRALRFATTSEPIPSVPRRRRLAHRPGSRIVTIRTGLFCSGIR
jgi:hypothetical protein